MTHYPIRCRITNGAQSTRVDVYDDISNGMYGGVSSQDFSAALARMSGPLDVHINSGGGDVFQGVAIAEALRTYKGRIVTYVDGLAASIASVIAQAGTERIMAPGSMMMIHDAMTDTYAGNEAEHLKTARTLGKVSDGLADIYARRAGGTKDGWRDKMLAETWYTAEEAVADGLADRIGGDSAAWPDGLDAAAVAARAPQPIMARIKQLSARSALKVRSAMMHGDHELWDPDGDGDCDACPEGDTDHDYWSADGEQLQSVPGKPMPAKKSAKVRDAKAKGVDNSEWDADKAWHAGAEAADPAAFYSAICAGRKEGDPSQQSSYALPYRYSPTSAPNAAAVRDALARIDQTEGLTNKEAAKAKLEKLMKKVNPDYEPAAQVDTSGIAALLAQSLGRGQK